MINGPRLSEGIPTPRRPSPRTPITRAPKPYVAPLPVGPTYPAWNPSPTVYNSPYYVPPSAPAAQQVSQQSFQPAVTNTTPGDSGGGGATAAAATQTKKGVDDFAKLYDSNSELAAVDSTFAEQRSLYGQLLKKYLADHDLNVKNLNEDARLGKEGIGQNRVRGLTSLNEDFAARGLGRSGLQAKEWDDSSQAFKKQETNVELQRVRGETDLNSRKNKYVGENGENGSNMSAARREAYARLVAKQDIV